MCLPGSICVSLSKDFILGGQKEGTFWIRDQWFHRKLQSESNSIR